MPKMVRQGDINSGGGVTPRGVPSVICNGRRVIVVGDPVLPHTCCGASGCDIHCGPVTTTGSSNVYAEGIKVNYVGHVDTCGHPRQTGSPDTYLGG